MVFCLDFHNLRMEFEVEANIRKLIGYTDNPEEGDGMVVPGGAIGNSYAIQLAIQKKWPDVKSFGFVEKGIRPPAIFFSEHAAFYYERYCIWEGSSLLFSIWIFNPNFPG